MLNLVAVNRTKNEQILFPFLILFWLIPRLITALLQQDISEQEFYGDLVYRFRNIMGKSNFSEQFRKLINHYKRISHSLNIMRQTAFLVINPIIVDVFASLFNCTTDFRATS